MLVRQRSETWASLAVRGRFSMDVVAVIGGVSYSAISAPVIDRALFTDTASIGHCTAASMMVSILTDDVIPAAASVEIRARLFDDTRASEWRTFGTFYIAKREENDGLVTLQCYDAMLKATQRYVDPLLPDDRIGWPKSMKACVDECAARIGVELDSRTVIQTGDAYQVAYPTNYTMQQVLEFIAACHGGNWIITPENKLRLIPLIAPPAETFDIIDYEYHKIHTDDGYKLVWQHYESGEIISHPAGGDLLNVPIVIGKITTSKPMTISRVTLARDEDLGYTAGDDTGVELRIENNPYACQAICDDLYDALAGMEYRPFTITQACYDPCTELGDWVLVGDKVRGTIYSQKVTLGIDFRADAAAPGKDETESEYPYLTEIQRLQQADERLRKYMETAKDEIDSKIEQTRTSILLRVAGTYATSESVNSSITLLADSITSEVSRAKGEESKLSSSITQTAESVSMKVTKGDVSSQLSVETGQVSIASNRFTVDSTNFKLTNTGGLTADNAKFTNVDASGSFTTTDGSSTLTMDAGGFDLYQGGTLVGTIRGDAKAHQTSSGSSLVPVMDITVESGSNGLIFSDGSSNTYNFAYNLGLDPNGYSEKFWFGDTVRFQSSVYANSISMTGLTLRDSSGEITVKHGTVQGQGDSFRIDGNLWVTGNVYGGRVKDRAVETKHYGTVGMNAVESAYAAFSDFGSAELDETGKAYVFFAPDFEETVDLSHDYLVFVTPTSENLIQRVEKQHGYFIVHGEPAASFDWFVYARQREYVNHRMERIAHEEIDPNAEAGRWPLGDTNYSVGFYPRIAANDNLDDLAQSYLQNYESEVNGYDN